jgi:dihydrofolate reductase
MELALVWAQARDAAGKPVIGAGGDIPWRVPEDFAHFRRLTDGHPIIMGVNTWNSLPKKPLPNRTNIVLDKDRVATLADAIAVAEGAPGGELIWIIGGGSVYRQTINLASRLEVTEIDLEIDGDTFAPEIDQNYWLQDAITDWLQSKTGTRYRFITFRKISD